MDDVPFLYCNSSAPLRRLTFVPATKPDTVRPPEGIELIYLRPGDRHKEADRMPRTAQTSRNPTANGNNVLFKEEDVKRGWSRVKRVGAGLQNLGNTCFMNSVLQCLTYTPPLVEILLHMNAPSAGGKEFDALLTTRQHFALALMKPGSIVSPTSHARNLKALNKSFRLGRQEDAHEYLIALLDAMHESLLAPLKPKPARSIQETSMIFQIFAGRICSQVRCTECGKESRTVDPFLDISLEITGSTTLEKALQKFTAVEYLEGENKYLCPQQATKVRASKRISIEKAPNVLLIQLKRFEFSMYGQKICKKVDFGTTLDMGPYMSDRRSPPVLYELYGVLVHYGHSVHSGHYFCFVRGPNGMWYQMDDTNVSPVGERVVLGQKAYILFYIRRDAKEGSRLSPPVVKGPPAVPAEKLAAELTPERPATTEAGPSSSGLRPMEDAAARSQKRKSDTGDEPGLKKPRQAKAATDSTGQEPAALPSTDRSYSQPQADAAKAASAKFAGEARPRSPASDGVDANTLRQRLNQQVNRTSLLKPMTPAAGLHPLHEMQMRSGQNGLSKRENPYKELRASFAMKKATTASGSSSMSQGKSLHGKSHRSFNQTLHLHNLKASHSQTQGGTPPGLGSPGLRGSSPLQPHGEAMKSGERRSPRFRLQSLLGSSPQAPKPVVLASFPGAAKSQNQTDSLDIPREGLSERGPTPRSREADLCNGVLEKPGDPEETVSLESLPHQLEQMLDEDDSALTDHTAASLRSGSKALSRRARQRAASLHRKGSPGVCKVELHHLSAEQPLPAEAVEANGLDSSNLPDGSSDDTEPSSNGLKRKKLRAVPGSSPDGTKAAKVTATTDPDQVRQVLGLAAEVSAAGPLGEEVWPGVRPDWNQTTSREEIPQRKALDEYDVEYDRGKTKKVRGLGQADTWDASPGNVFQTAQDTTRRSKRRYRKRGHQES